MALRQGLATALYTIPMGLLAGQGQHRQTLYALVLSFAAERL